MAYVQPMMVAQPGMVMQPQMMVQQPVVVEQYCGPISCLIGWLVFPCIIFCPVDERIVSGGAMVYQQPGTMIQQPMYNNGLNNNGMNMGIDYNGGNGMMMNGMSAMPGQQPVMMQPGGQQPQMYAQQPQQYMAPQQPQMVAPQQQQQQQQFAPIPSYKATVQPATAGY